VDSLFGCEEFKHQAAMYHCARKTYNIRLLEIERTFVVDHYFLLVGNTGYEWDRDANKARTRSSIKETLGHLSGRRRGIREACVRLLYILGINFAGLVAKNGRH